MRVAASLTVGSAKKYRNKYKTPTQSANIKRKYKAQNTKKQKTIIKFGR